MDMHGAASTRIRHVLITGPPGIGKTTVCKKVLPLLENKLLTCDGFFTEEIRSSSNKRIGFDVVPIKNYEDRLPLARSMNLLGQGEDTAKKYRVGNYAVFVKNFENIALPIFQTNSDVLLIDEIGKMELLSELFIDKINEFLYSQNDEGNKRVRCILATIPEIFPKHLTLLKKIRSDQRFKILEVNYDNRDNLPEDISNIIYNIVKKLNA